MGLRNNTINDKYVEIETEKLKIYRTKKVLSLFGFIYRNDTDWFLYTGKFFQFVEIEQELYRKRYLLFDDVLSYEYFWSQWKEIWYFKSKI